MATISRLDDPGALGGVLTGVSFIGGLTTGLSLADTPFPPGPRQSAGLSIWLVTLGAQRRARNAGAYGMTPPEVGTAPTAN